MIKVCAVENISARDNFFSEFSLFRISFDEILCDIYDKTARALNLKVKKNLICRERFYSRGQQRCKLIETQKSVYTREKRSIPTEFVSDSNMTGVSLSWDTNMATSC